MSTRQGILVTATFALFCGIAVGWWLTSMGMNHDAHTAGSTESGTGGEDDILYWVAPMDPGYRRDKPGKSPMGMDLVPVYADRENGNDSMRIRSEVLNAIGARSAAVERQNLSLVFTTPAAIRPNADRIAHIHVRTEGWVEKLHANAEGNSVREGDLLFDIYSPALVSAQEEYLQAVKSDRAPLARAGEERLRALGMLPAQIKALRDAGRAQPLYQQRAPQDGVILELNIREGMYVQPGTTIMSLADISSVWLEAALFPSQLDQVSVGDGLPFRTLSSDTSTRRAVVDYIYPTIDDATRTARVRAVVDNADGLLRPGQYVRADFHGPVRANVLAVPNAAVIRSRGSTRVILDLGEGRFRPADVSTGLVTASHTEIMSGLSEGENVVISAQFLIDSEASLDPALGRMNASEPEHQHQHQHQHQQKEEDHNDGHMEHSASENPADPGSHENHNAHENHSAPKDPGPPEDHSAHEGHSAPEDHSAHEGHSAPEDHSAHEGHGAEPSGHDDPATREAPHVHDAAPPEPPSDPHTDHAHHNPGAGA